MFFSLRTEKTEDQVNITHVHTVLPSCFLLLFPVTLSECCIRPFPLLHPFSSREP